MAAPRDADIFDGELIPDLGDLALPLFGRDTFTGFAIDPQNNGDSVLYINLFFTEINLDTSDIVSVYDGENTDAPLLGTYFGTDIPDQIQSTGKSLSICA